MPRPRRYYLLKYYTPSSMELSRHRTRHAALKAAYDRLDMEQRDALGLGEQEAANAAAKERGALASAWASSARGRDGVVYRSGRVDITRHHTDPTP